MQNNYGVLTPFKCDADYYNRFICLRVQNYAIKSKIPNNPAIILLIRVDIYAKCKKKLSIGIQKSHIVRYGLLIR